MRNVRKASITRLPSLTKASAPRTEGGTTKGRCRVCVEAEGYLGTSVLADPEEENIRIGNMRLVLQQHRGEIQDLLNRLTQRDLSRP